MKKAIEGAKIKKVGEKFVGFTFIYLICRRNYTESSMSTKTMTKMIAEYFKTQPVLKAWLFGSFARGEETAKSDVDLLVMFDHSTPIGLFAYARMHRELEERLGRKVDLVEEGCLMPFAEESVNRDKFLIYERTT